MSILILFNHLKEEIELETAEGRSHDFVHHHLLGLVLSFYENGTGFALGEFNLIALRFGLAFILAGVIFLPACARLT